MNDDPSRKQNMNKRESSGGKSEGEDDTGRRKQARTEKAVHTLDSYVSSSSSSVDQNIVHVLHDFIGPSTLAALREECETHYQRASVVDELDRSCSIDLFETISLEDNHPGRTDVDEYLRVRWRNASLKPSSPQAIRDIRIFLFKTAPDALRKLLGYSEVYLFNENYIVKSGGGELEFRWHTDEREQLKCMHFLSHEEEEEGREEDDTRFDVYYSLWTALDDCNEDNGTLVFPLGTKIVDYRSNQSMNPYVPINSSSRINVDGISILVKAGSAVLFSSKILHRSGTNSTRQCRRVLYAQYSNIVITGAMVDSKGDDINGCETDECDTNGCENKERKLLLEERPMPMLPGTKEGLGLTKNITPLNFAVRCS